jgi:hypothetical protein
MMLHHEKSEILQPNIRDRSFNLKVGGYGFFFRTTRVLEYLFFFVAQSAIFFSRIQH